MGNRRGVAHLTLGRVENQFARRLVNGKPLNPLVAHGDLVWIGTGLEIEGVFQTSLVSAVDQVNPWIDLRVDHTL